LFTILTVGRFGWLGVVREKLCAFVDGHTIRLVVPLEAIEASLYRFASRKFGIVAMAPAAWAFAPTEAMSLAAARSFGVDFA
jgi:hypothetical protein